MLANRMRLIGPRFVFFSGVFDKNVFTLPDLAELAIKYDVSRVVFWNYVQYDEIKDGLAVEVLTSLPKSKLEKAIDSLQKTREILEAQQIECVFAADFIDILQRRLQHAEPEGDFDSASKARVNE